MEDTNVIEKVEVSEEATTTEITNPKAKIEKEIQGLENRVAEQVQTIEAMEIPRYQKSKGKIIDARVIGEVLEDARNQIEEVLPLDLVGKVVKKKDDIPCPYRSHG